MGEDMPGMSAGSAPARMGRNLVAAFNQAARHVPPWSLYLLALGLAAGWFWRALSGGLGPDPARALELQYGEWALQFLIATLAITPLMRLAGIRLMHLRRALGLTAFGFATLHLSVWLFLDMQLLWSQIVSDILKRPYVTLGMAAFALLTPLALTSNNRSIRRLGHNWRKLHKLAYPAAILAAAHFLLVVKGWPLRPFAYSGIILALLAMRLCWQGWIPGRLRGFWGSDRPFPAFIWIFLFLGLAKIFCVS